MTVKKPAAARLLQVAAVLCFVAGVAILLLGVGDASGPGCAGFFLGGFLLAIGIACLYLGRRAARAAPPG